MFRKILEILWVFLKLGCTSFGGPTAHLGYFHDEFVLRRQWLTAEQYADLVALCQILPGPASSQVGMAIGKMRAGALGALIAWLGFTLPSAAIMIFLGVSFKLSNIPTHGGGFHALKVVAVPIVAYAIWTMAQKLCTDKIRVLITLAASIVLILFNSVLVQMAVLACSAFAGFLFIKEKFPSSTPLIAQPKKQASVLYVASFFSLLLILPLSASLFASTPLRMFDSFYRAGALVFGGGHVVLPLLQSELVGTAGITDNTFLAGYGAVQSVPGPLFSFAAYLGAVADIYSSSVLGGIICLIGIFLPAYLLVMGVLPFWQTVRNYKFMPGALAGINAAVVGLLIAAFYHPVWPHGIQNWKDLGIATLGFILLSVVKSPPWLVVLISVGVGFVVL